MGSSATQDVVAVAVSKHRSSLLALEWTLLNKSAPPGNTLKLVHVRPVLHSIPTPMGASVPVSRVSSEIVAAYRADLHSKTKQGLQTHLALCFKSKVNAELIIAEGDNVAITLLDQVSKLRANKLVLGRSPDTFLRRLKGSRLPDNVLKHASNSCTVFVVSNGKLISMQCAKVSPLSFDIDTDSYTNGGISSCTLSSSLRSGSSFSAQEQEERDGKELLVWEQRAHLEIAPYYPNAAIRQQQKLPVGVDTLKLEQLEHHLQDARQVAAIAKQNVARVNAYAKEEGRKREQAEVEAQIAKEELARQAKKLEATRLALEAEIQKRSLLGDDQVSELPLSRAEDLPIIGYRKYEFEELVLATDNFALKNQVGEGGYGCVYKGRLHYTAVAIKVLKKESIQGLKQFQREVEFLSHMHHPNIVLLLGACPEQGCLVYEYLAHGSLEDHLRGKGNTTPLSWQTRCRIVTEVATALLFLHSLKPNPCVHRDLKPANILLDQNLVSKLGDVGLAALAPSNIVYDVTQYKETTPVGSYAYIDPQYRRTGVFTPRSDVYALGIVMLQLLTGKPPLGLPTIVKAAFKESKLDLILDSNGGSWPLHVAMELARIALQFCRSKPKKRPDLKEVLPELEAVANFCG